MKVNCRAGTLLFCFSGGQYIQTAQRLERCNLTKTKVLENCPPGNDHGRGSRIRRRPKCVGQCDAVVQKRPNNVLKCVFYHSLYVS